MDVSVILLDAEVMFSSSAPPSRGHSPKELNADLIEKMVREKVHNTMCIPR